VGQSSIPKNWVDPSVRLQKLCQQSPGSNTETDWMCQVFLSSFADNVINWWCIVVDKNEIITDAYDEMWRADRIYNKCRMSLFWLRHTINRYNFSGCRCCIMTLLDFPCLSRFYFSFHFCNFSLISTWIISFWDHYWSYYDIYSYPIDLYFTITPVTISKFADVCMSKIINCQCFNTCIVA